MSAKATTKTQATEGSGRSDSKSRAPAKESREQEDVSTRVFDTQRHNRFDVPAEQSPSAGWRAVYAQMGADR